MTGDLESAHPDPHTSTGLMLWRVTNAWQRAIRATLAPFELTHVQFVLLAVLASSERGTPVTQRDLAERAATDAMMTSQVLRALESKGLVERAAHPTDRRARVLSITPAGLTVVNRANVAVEAADADFFAALGGQVAPFTRSLGVLDAHARATI